MKFRDLKNRDNIDSRIRNAGFVVVNCSRTEYCKDKNGRKMCFRCGNKCASHDSYSNSYIWIGKFLEGKNKISRGSIGCRNCHFEYGCEKGQTYLDLHFEGFDSYHKFEKQIINKLYPNNNAPEHLNPVFFDSDENRTRLKVIRFASSDSPFSQFPLEFDGGELKHNDECSDDNINEIVSILEKINEYGKDIFEGKTLIEKIEEILNEEGNKKRLYT